MTWQNDQERRHRRRKHEAQAAATRSHPVKPRVPKEPTQKPPALSPCRIPRQVDVRRVVTKRTDKRGRQLGAFETLQDAKKERRHRLRLLKTRKDKRSRGLAKLLKRCRKKRRCESLACPVCARIRRIVQSAMVLKLLASYRLPDLRFVTLINPADAVPVDELHTLDTKDLIHRLRRQLERVGIDKTQTFLIGAIDGEFDEGWWLYQPHLHAISRGITKADLEKVVAGWFHHSDSVRVRKRIESMSDLPRVVAYLDKSFWPPIARKNNPFEVHPHGKQRPPRNIETEILLWLHRQRPSNLRLLYGVKAYRRCIVKT